MTLQKEIAEAFLEKLEGNKDIDADKLKKLRELISDTKKLKADDVVRILSAPSGGEIK